MKGFDPATQMPDDVRWFDVIGKCRVCPKPAVGKLMGSRNESYGQYCEACASKRLSRAKQEREAASAYRIVCNRETT